MPLNLPNALTLFRVVLVPVVVVALLGEIENGTIVAAAVVAIAASTDSLDGYLARSRRDITDFGRVMDPIADKLLITAALISLVSLGRVAPWVAMVIIGRELAVSGLRIWAADQGVTVHSSGLAKRKTLLQIATVLALILASDPGAAWALVLTYATVVITVISGAQYFVSAWRGVAARRAAAAEAVPEPAISSEWGSS